MKTTVIIDSTTIVNADSLEYIKTLPDNSIDLIATDPPYFRVKNIAWDRQWQTEAEYLTWLDLCLKEFWRVLKPAGSLYLFCSSRLAADIEILMRQRFNVLNQIIWAKPSGPWNRQHKDDLRSFFPATERIILAEHYAGPLRVKDTGHDAKRTELKQNVLMPLIDYFKSARAALGVSTKAIHQATGKQMASHWFSESQWQLPNEHDYLILQRLFDRIAHEKYEQNQLQQPHHQLVEQHKVLARRYADLAKQLIDLRRPFRVSSLVPFTDVWTYPSVPFYAGKHPCEKPAAMMRDIINASSRPGDVVADFFMGSGSTVKEALKLGRFAIGVELELERFEQTKSEIQLLLNSHT